MRYIIDRAREVGRREQSVQQTVRTLAYEGDQNAHEWRVTVTSDGAALQLSEYAIAGYFKPPESDGEAIRIEGTASGNVASVVLTAECYAKAGRVQGRMVATKAGQQLTLDAIALDVNDFTVSAVIDMSGTLLDVEGMIAATSAMRAATADARAVLREGAELLSPPIISVAEGEACVATDSADRPLRGLTVYGKTTQDGTPSEDAPVDPMGTGTASPLRIVTAGRNLAALTPRLEDNFGITSSYDAQTGVVTVTGTATALAFVSYWLREPIPAGVPLVIGMGNGSSDDNITIRAQSASENANTNIGMLNETNRVVNKVFAHAFEFLSIRVNAGATVNMKLQIGVTVGSDSAGYTWTHPDDPTSAQIIIPGFHFAVGGLLQGVPAISGGNVTDGRQWIADTVEYDAQAGTAQLVQRVGSVTYFGGADENWVKGGSGSYFAIRRADKSSASHGLCTHYPGLAINAGEYKVGFTAATDKEYIRFRPTGYADMTVDQWRAQLDASPVTVLYALSEPVTTPITGDELTALAQLRSRYPATTIYNDAGAQMAARYVADTKNYVDQRIEQLTNAVVSLGGNV